MSACIGPILKGLSAISAVLGIYTFNDNHFTRRERGVSYRFAVGLDGTAGPHGPLRNAGGTLPEIFTWNQHGNFLGTTRDLQGDQTCASGHTDCDVFIDQVYQQPTYTLFTGKDDAVCLAYITTTWEAGDRFAWLGNWARACNAPWYYSDIYVETDTRARKVECAWVDKNGDVATTAIQIHWPDYSPSFRSTSGSVDDYCHNKPTLWFHTDYYPTYIHYYDGKRNMFKRNPSEIQKTAEAISEKDKPKKSNRLADRMKNDTRLVKSKDESHLATKLCESPHSIGPSFVSYQERKFCHMADKKIYAFCEDTPKGDCWDDVKHEIVHKGAHGALKRAENPAVKFTEVLAWGEEKKN